MSKERIELGKSGEDVACDFLKGNGYKILERNYRSRLGEVDIIARDKDTLCFIEVKTRRGEDFGLPIEAVSRTKQRQIAKAALAFLKEHNLLDGKARFDVVSVLYKTQDNKPQIDLINNAFELGEDFTF